MRSEKINRDWLFGLGALDVGKRISGQFGGRTVNLPHDYMIEGGRVRGRAIGICQRLL